MTDKFFNWLTKNITTIYFIIIGLTIIAPLLFVQNWTGIDFNGTGPIGDTIGGLTSPFLNFLSVTLLYLTLKEQMKFNIKQVDIDEKNKDYETVSNLINQIKQEINELTIIVNEPSCGRKEVKGIYTLFEVSKLAMNGTLRNVVDEYSLKPFLLSFSFIIHSIQQFLEKNHTAKINENEKIIFYSIITKYKTPFFMLIDALHKFGHRSGKVRTEDSEFCLMNEMKKLLEQEFEKYKQEKNNSTQQGFCEIGAEVIN